MYKRQRKLESAEGATEFDEDYDVDEDCEGDDNDTELELELPSGVPCDDNFRAIWVAGFNMGTGDEELTAMFAPCGDVRRATIIHEKYSWISKG